jgi:hypothetical protein
MNVEISGLPRSGEPFKGDLTAVRDAFKTKMQFSDDDPPADGSYIKFDPPLHVQVTGSLFFDVEHLAPHTVGPTDHRPKTAWEIHPVRNIAFVP